MDNEKKAVHSEDILKTSDNKYLHILLPLFFSVKVCQKDAVYSCDTLFLMLVRQTSAKIKKINW